MTVLQSSLENFERVCRGRALEARARLHRFLTERTPDAVLHRSLAILVLVTAVTAYFSETFFFPDEHFQILEFMSYKLGITAAGDLPWEFGARLRPWMQPFLYYLIAKPLMLAGVRDLFTVVFILRLATGAFALVALAAFAKLLVGDLERPEEKRAYARMLPFMGFLPYLFVRSSSETFSADFFAIGLVVAVQASRSNSWRRMAVAGVMCGMAFACRYQSAFLVLGLLGWLAIVAKSPVSRLAAFAAGGVVPVVAGLFVDRWGYGEWCFPAWNYLNVNVFQGLAATEYGSSPFYAYLYLMPSNIFLPIAVVLMAAMIVACLRNPRHYITWITAPFFIAHCLLAHKEERFLFPLAIYATAYPVLAFAPSPDRLFAFFGRLWAWRRSILTKAVAWSTIAAMVLLAVYPFGIRPHLKMAKYLYRHFPTELTAYTFNELPFKSYPMYRPPHFLWGMLHSRTELEALLAKGPVNLISYTPTLPENAMPEDARARLMYSEFPFASDPQLASWGTRMLCWIADLRRTTPLKPPRLNAMTLFRVEHGNAISADVAMSPCTPDWRCTGNLRKCRASRSKSGNGASGK